MTSDPHLPRILFIGTFPPHPGGSAAANGQMLRGLADLGHAVRGIAPATGFPSSKVDDLGLEVSRYEVEFTGMAHTIIKNALTAEFVEAERGQLIPLLDQVLTRFCPDILILGRESYPLVVEDSPLLAEVPTIVISHTGTFLETIQQWEFDSSVLLPLLRSMSRVVLIAEHAREAWEQIGFSNLEVIPNAVDPGVFRPADDVAAIRRKFDIAPNKTVFLHASNFKPVKRIPDLLDATRTVLQQRDDVELLMVGDGALHAEVRESCRRPEFAGAVRFFGWMEREELLEMYQASDCLVMPSASEGLPMAALEAQAAGCGVVATDVGGFREIIVDGESGLLFPVGDVDALSTIMMNLCDDVALRARLRSHARQAALRRPLSRNVLQYHELIMKLVSA